MNKLQAFKAIFQLWIGAFSAAGLAFLLQIILARRLGPEDYGSFSSIWVMITILSPIAGFGVSQFWLRIFGKEGWGGLRWWHSSDQYIKISTLVGFILAAGWAYLGPYDGGAIYVIMMLSMHLIGQLYVDLATSKFQLEHNFVRVSFWQSMPAVIRISIVSICIIAAPDFINIYFVSAVFMVSSLIVGGAGYFEIRKMNTSSFELKGHQINFNTRSETPKAFDVLRGAWPFGLASILYLVYFQSSIVVLQYLVGDESAGYYNVAFLVMSAVYIIPGVVYQKFLIPNLHRWTYQDRDSLKRAFVTGNWAMLFLGLAATGALLLVGPWGIRLLFGGEYESSIIVLKLLALGASVRFLVIGVGAVLVTAENMKRKVLYMGLVAIFNVGANVVVVPIWGLKGAAVVALMSDMFLLLLYWFSAKRYVFLKN